MGCQHDTVMMHSGQITIYLPDNNFTFGIKFAPAKYRDLLAICLEKAQLINMKRPFSVIVDRGETISVSSLFAFPHHLIFLDVEENFLLEVELCYSDAVLYRNSNFLFNQDRIIINK